MYIKVLQLPAICFVACSAVLAFLQDINHVFFCYFSVKNTWNFRQHGVSRVRSWVFAIPDSVSNCLNVSPYFFRYVVSFFRNMVCLYWFEPRFVLGDVTGCLLESFLFF